MGHKGTRAQGLKGRRDPEVEVEVEVETDANSNNQLAPKRQTPGVLNIDNHYTVLGMGIDFTSMDTDM